ncbi:MAG: xanthine dehydrogenase family protein subunit M [Pseudomonadota bacterium]
MKNVHLPGNMEELWPILEQETDMRLYCGGTDLLVKMRAGEVNPLHLVCLERIEELQGIREDLDGLWIGAGTTHTHLLNHSLTRRCLPVLAKALETIGSPLIRNMGTIGGNICSASPAGDTLPPLYALDAEVELRSRDTIRAMPLCEFITGPGETRLKRGEILTGVRVENGEKYNRQHFEKIGQRRDLACAIASLAAVLQVSSSGVVQAARLAWGSVGPMVVTSREVEEALIGETLSLNTLQKAASLARRAVSPIDDARASSVYRREVSGNLLLRLLQSMT